MDAISDAQPIVSKHHWNRTIQNANCCINTVERLHRESIWCCHASAAIAERLKRCVDLPVYHEYDQSLVHAEINTSC